MIPLVYYLVLASVLFAIGAYGVLTKRNAVRVLMAIEIMMNAAIINLVAFSVYMPYNNISGQVFALFAIAIAAAEAAIGLAIFIVIFRVHGTIDINEIRRLRG
ncbi:MAG TPA: NADH-quinone oxidoreductase subunit NuoK [Euryarchaeota archaeon]|nr:NADH-quinone oxidoreductase subunit K [archaeon BMS3Abin16]GBE56157.1 NADH-quinone oxidoreductase subunit K [archaeon BMS3Bbin16]HDH28800.1 NADH-quinone oxidoreductase subunit NuoK [Euryarchaeota archaeon]HDY74283.1 NADH-quinone oxidoreductase subunit NuoK [Euryarchaeota archaeon]